MIGIPNGNTDKISTHAPRAGSDVLEINHNDKLHNFNPRSPCGERRKHSYSYIRHDKFQPTLPVRGATFRSVTCGDRGLISTHAPRAGSD